MNLLTRALSLLRAWLGLGDPSDDHLTPSHGWLLPVPEKVAAGPDDRVPRPAQRLP